MGPLQALSPLALPPLHIAISGTGEINSRSAEVDVHQRLSNYCLHLPRTTEGKGERATLPVLLSGRGRQLTEASNPTSASESLHCQRVSE